ncbi:MAG: DUF4251 domain-containing protein [Alistipes sp.]|nr:DUF4251 domain-containing protein [Alistipes sp.]
MKRILLFIVIAVLATALCVVGYTQSSKSVGATAATKSIKAEQREERHKQREARRAERLAEYERFVDSIVLARNFKFIPQNIQQEPAGSVRLLNNPNFELSVWGDEVDICLPYIKGVTPPYYYVMFNYTLPSVSRYVTEQTRDGWLVTFTTSLFSATDYQFSLAIYSSSGTATLTISSPWYPDVEYDGSIIGQN